MVQRTKYQQKQRSNKKNKSLTEAKHERNGASCSLMRQRKGECTMSSAKQIQFLNASSARSSKRSRNISVMSVTLSATVTAIATVATASSTKTSYTSNNNSYPATTTNANISGSLNATLEAEADNFAGTTLSTTTMTVAQEECSTAIEEYSSHFGVMLAVPEWEALLTAVVLSVIIVLTIIGNILVILSVFTYKPLRIVQNFFIVSLAVADLTVAILVLPFNVAYSILGRWVFGIHLCKMWLTSDILCCTSSILNLCAIALDRYWAITDPINYAQKRTVGRVLLLIAGVWILSLVISSPPLVGWNDWPEEFTSDTPCRLTSERGYVVYSSLGSFFIPLVIMTIVYIEIYIATRRRLRERAQASKINTLPLKSGDAEAAAASIVSTGGKASGLRNFFADYCCCGKDSTSTATPMIQHDQESISSETHINNQPPPNSRIEQHRVVVVTQKKSRRAKIKDSIKHGKTRSKKQQQQQPEQSGKNIGSNNATEHLLQTPEDVIKRPSGDEKDTSTSAERHENSSESQNQPSSDMGASNICITLCTGDGTADGIDKDDENMSLKITPPQSSTGAASTAATPLQKKPSGVYQFIEEKQKISLSKERRAARTLGIIMGVFVICWLPFFLMYVILPFCESCCPTGKFINFITWLGYINSGLNPVIYTIFNLEYRRAFKRLLGINC